MAADTTKQVRDRNFDAGEEAFEIRRIAEKHGLTVEQVQHVIGRVGNSREALGAAARLLHT